MSGPEQFGVGNVTATVRNWIDKSSGIYTSETTPDETTFAGIAKPGALLVDFVDTSLWINKGTQELPNWTIFSTGGGLPGLGQLCVARFDYDFSIDGGAIGTIPTIAVVPKDAIIVMSLLDNYEQITSNGLAEIGLSIETSGDVVALDTLYTLPRWTLGIRETDVKINTAGTFFKTTQQRMITMDISVAALTAGRFTSSTWFCQSNS